MMYRVRRVQIGNSGEIAWESKRAEIMPWPVEKNLKTRRIHE